MLTSNGTARLAVSRQIRRPTLRLVLPEQMAPVLVSGGQGLLADPERAEYEGLPARRRRDWLAGRVAAKLAVRDIMRRRGSVSALQAIVVGNEATGAPTFAVADRSDRELGLNLSIAHAGGAGLAAVADTARCGEVGVDLEPDEPLSPEVLPAVLTPPFRAQALGERPHERHAVERGAPVLIPSPLQLWMLKEAVFKTGRGETFGSPFDVELSWHAGRVRVRQPTGRPTRAKYRYSWRSFRGMLVCCVVRTLPETN